MKNTIRKLKAFWVLLIQGMQILLLILFFNHRDEGSLEKWPMLSTTGVGNTQDGQGAAGGPEQPHRWE